MPQASTSCVRHLITPEYPPQLGGVSDYVQQLAEALQKAGEELHVWCPPVPDASSAPGPVHVHHDLGKFRPRDLKRVGEQLDRFPGPRRLLVQWVPHGYGYKSMNLAFCIWLRNRARRSGDQIEIMVHEAFLAFEGSWRQYLAAFVHRLMTVILLRAVQRVWVSIPRCEHLWRPYTLGRPIPFQWLPLPSNVPSAGNPREIASIRSQYAGQDGLLIGHFGTFGKSVNSLLEGILVGILDRNINARVILIGPGSDFMRSFLGEHPHLAGKIYTTGPLAATDPVLSRHISACDLMIQPYPDGVSSRRTSFMAALNHGKTVVTTSGPSTETVWFESDGIAWALARNTEDLVATALDLCGDPAKRTAMGRAAQLLYKDRFDIHQAVAALRLDSEKLACVS